MHKRLFFLTAVLVCLPLLTACGKSKDERAIEKAREWELSNFSEGVTPPPKPAVLPKELIIDVPEPVRASVKAVTMGIGNRKTKEIKKFTVRLGQTVQVPGTGFSIKVASYLPNFVLHGKTVTSKADSSDDPVVRATIYEKGKPIFDGFIFKKHRTPSFMTDEYAIGLLDVAK